MVVFVLNKSKKPLMPCSEKRARKMLRKGAAVVDRIEPFTIRLKEKMESIVSPLRLKIDPGYKTTGIAILRENNDVGHLIYASEITHKLVSRDIQKRAMQRRSRRGKKLRHRPPRFKNRKKRQTKFKKRYKCKYAWLAPSLVSRVDQTVNTVKKLIKICPINAISVEHVKFDTQLMENPDIEGVEYQQGELWGYELKELLLEKFDRKCVYCKKTVVVKDPITGKTIKKEVNTSNDKILEVEHVIPRSRPSSSNRMKNLVISCRKCNRIKGNRTPKEWLVELESNKKETKLNLARIENIPKIPDEIKKSLKGAAHLNSSRWFLYERLKELGLPLECGTGARTKMQRKKRGFPKTHYYDAVCVGKSTPEKIVVETEYVNSFRAMGRGHRLFLRVDKYGFPRRKTDGTPESPRLKSKTVNGFMTGDIVDVTPQGKRWKDIPLRGRINIRKSGKFRVTFLKPIKDNNGKEEKETTGYASTCGLVQRGDGWRYGKEIIAKSDIKVEKSFSESQNSKLDET